MSGRILLVTGTGTGVGKTIVTAAIASLSAKAGKSVAVVKPGQTGVSGDDIGDADDIKRLSGVGNVREFVRYPDPISPAAAARISGKPTLICERRLNRSTHWRPTTTLCLSKAAGGFAGRVQPRAGDDR